MEFNDGGRLEAFALHSARNMCSNIQEKFKTGELEEWYYQRLREELTFKNIANVRGEFNKDNKNNLNKGLTL